MAVLWQNTFHQVFLLLWPLPVQNVMSLYWARLIAVGNVEQSLIRNFLPSKFHPSAGHLLN